MVRQLHHLVVNPEEHTMRSMMTILMIAQLSGCAWNSRTVNESQKIGYKPLPVVELSTFMANDRIAAVYVRHSGCNVLLQLLPVGNDDGDYIRKDERKLIFQLASSQLPEFTSARYE